MTVSRELIVMEHNNMTVLFNMKLIYKLHNMFKHV